MWLRVFGMKLDEPTPAELLALANSLWPGSESHFRGDDLGWIDLTIRGSGKSLLSASRFVVHEEDGLRQELQSWAAWAEPRGDKLILERIICTLQLFTIKAEAADREPAFAICKWLAEATEGIIQVDGEGLFDWDCRLLLAEEAPA